MRALVCTAIAVVTLVISACAQDAAPASSARSKKALPPGPLHSISITGNQLYPSAEIVKQTGLTLGMRVDPASLAAARNKLQATELFTSVAYQYRTTGGAKLAYDVTYQVTEDQQVFPIRFERLGMSAGAIEACLRDHVAMYSDRIPGTEGILHRYAAAVQSCVAQNGEKVEVKAAVSNDDPKQLTVLFMPSTAAPVIAQVFVSGNEAVDTGTILRAVNQIAVGVPLTDTRLKMILQGTIEPLYAAKGYPAVTFPKVETEPSKTEKGMLVKVQIKDGPQFKFGSIRFRGNGLDEDEIRSTIPFKTGQVYNGEKVDSFRLALTHQMRKRGLLDTSITTDTQTDDAKRAVNVTYNVTPGAVYSFAKLDIIGLDITSEPAIHKLWGEKPGHPFNPDYPDYFLKRVQQEGLFDNLADTHSDYTSDASTHNVTVHLYFKGGKSAQQKAREEKEKRDKQQSDGSWSPY